MNAIVSLKETNPGRMKASARRGALRRRIVFIGALAGLTLAQVGRASAADVVVQANQTVAHYKKTDPALTRFFDHAAGYVVFPGIGKGGAGVGGAYGKGVLFENGKAVGNATLTQVTVGAQLGGQTYSEVIFFETSQALADFKAGKFTFAAQVSAVALKSGASADAQYKSGVAVFTATKGGLMAEASLGGQKFSYAPLGGKT
jgi:lipid-binding SYLF domain-containing protein